MTFIKTQLVIIPNDAKSPIVAARNLLKRLLAQQFEDVDLKVVGAAISGMSAATERALNGGYDSIGRMVHTRWLNVASIPLDVWSAAWVPALFEEDTPQIQNPETKRLFIVHGRDHSQLAEIKGFIAALGLEPIVLAEVTGQSRTIIQKLEDEGDCCFAFVLVTPDDIGKLAQEESEPSFRARQNVVFELGYFVGRLGRERVGIFSQGDVEWPSDWGGVECYKLDDQWKNKLVGELSAAGIEINHSALWPKAPNRRR